MRRLSLLFPYVLLSGILAVLVISNWPTDRHAEAMPRMDATCEPCGMTVDPASAISATINGRDRSFCSTWCRDQSAAIPSNASGDDDGERLIDVVCNMEVNAQWRITAPHDGQTYYFCTQRCRDEFQRDPQTYLAAKCIVCNEQLGSGETFAATYLGHTYRLCSEAHRAAFKEDPASYFMHSMWGIPTWLYYASIAIILVVSFGLFDWLGRRIDGASTVSPASSNPPPRFGADHIRGEGERLGGCAIGGMPGGAATISLPILAAQTHPLTAMPATTTQRADRFDLLSISWVNAALRSRVFRFTLQAIVAVLFLMIIAAGLFGNQNPALNIAPILTWTIWWGLLIVLIMFAGKSWCYVCPWDAIAGWTERLAFWKKKDIGLSLNLKWPRFVRNIFIATLLFVGLTWIELGFGVTMKPRITAYLAIAMLFMAVASALLFEKKSFCRYACLVGRVSGLYALFASSEIRAKKASVCTACKTKECVKGSETAYGCPTFLYPGKLSENTYCIQCMECVQACPHDNLAVNLRPWGTDLVAQGKPRADEAYLALLMLAITGFHGLTMTPAWQQLIDLIRDASGAGRILGFSAGMTLLMLGPIAIYAVLVGVSKRLGDGKTVAPTSYRDYFIRYAYALLPIALFYHIAHNCEHLLMEGPKVIAMMSDPFGWGWNMLGTASWTIPPLISLQQLWVVQVVLVLVGHVYSLWVAQKTSLRLFGSARAAFRSQLPMLMGMICFSVFSLWLLKQPMEMRTSAM